MSQTKNQNIIGEGRATPYQNILQSLVVPRHLKVFLPKKWELLGDVLLLKLPLELEALKKEIAKAYAEELQAKTVLRDLGIEGDLREPKVELLWGNETETVHKENGVKFKLDCAKLMFSSGNIDERIRMASVAVDGEIVVDMFAGIGFFSIPMAVHSQPKKIFACELNPIAYQYLCENIHLNDVENSVVPILGDNRDLKEEGIADRVVMGYLEDTYHFLPKALDLLKDEGGVIHYHEKCPNELMEERPLENVKKEVKKKGRSMELLGMRSVKSYAPGVSHVVLDVRVGS
ncbi:MAG: class I SAM-dependent methyltransferase family protein [Methanomassiliicoccales archaeon]|nr:MAG: class I SAM-dependent methyltransferase family protein [Methanomassiliicoccales archaeon]